ncbi:MAG: hypothetical protein QOK40_2826 [Miltoncostaeaceae bacterium]|nr:hypothetical protein [Miltoncostaeaceae bacterium]
MGRRLRDRRIRDGTLIAMSSPLQLDVLVVPYQQIVGLVPPMGEGEATWPATTVSLISGEHDAVLIDALLTPEDAGRAVDWAAFPEAIPGAASATSTNRSPRAIRPRSWSTG